MTLNAWNYINLSQETPSGLTKLSVNGTVISEDGLNTSDWTYGTGPLLGNNSSLNAPANAYFDDVRITVGATKPNSIPTSEFPIDSGSQYVWETGKSRGLTFNANHYKSNFATVASMPTGSSPRTVLFWYKQEIVNNNAEILQIGSVNSAGRRFSPFINGSIIYIEGAGAAAQMSHTPDTNWHMFAATLSGTTFSTIQLYLDGTPRTTTYTSGHIGVNTDNQFAIANLVLYGFDFYGLLDDIRIHNRALSAAEVKYIYDDSQSMRYEAINHRGYDDSVFKAPSASGGLIRPQNRSIIYGGGMGL
jgi:hypothetical protein